MDGASPQSIFVEKDDMAGLDQVLDPQFSPDMKSIDFAASSQTKRGVYRLDLATREVSCLTPVPARFDQYQRVAFTPDGKRLLIVAQILPPRYYSHSFLA